MGLFTKKAKKDGENPPQDASDAALRVAEALKTGGLEPTHIIEAITDGDSAFVAAALATLSGYPEATVQRILASTDTKTLTALVWKAQQPMRISIQIQMRLMQVPHTAMVQATDEGEFPMTPMEMEQALDAFGKDDTQW